MGPDSMGGCREDEAELPFSLGLRRGGELGLKAVLGRICIDLRQGSVLITR